MVDGGESDERIGREKTLCRLREARPLLDVPRTAAPLAPVDGKQVLPELWPILPGVGPDDWALGFASGSGGGRRANQATADRYSPYHVRTLTKLCPNPRQPSLLSSIVTSL